MAAPCYACVRPPTAIPTSTTRLHPCQHAMTLAEQVVLASLVAASRVLWVRLGNATDADVNRLGAAMIAAKDLLESQKDKT